MSSEPIISLKNLSKCYHIYDKPRHRLMQMLTRKNKQYFREFWALRDLDLEVKRGQVFGVIGRNGSGKSTLLQLVCGTLNPSLGDMQVDGRIAALLELGAGFNPEFTGRENLYLSASLSGLSQDEIKASEEDIIDFSGIRDFIDQPVKTYSSGMYVRLAFSVATNVDPDILVIDEALSVGDGEFSRRSFDRIMGLKAAGKTILFCSHALYQVEALCDSVIWLDNGVVKKIGGAREVISDYSLFLSSMSDAHNQKVAQTGTFKAPDDKGPKTNSSPTRITSVELSVNDMPPDKNVHANSKQDRVNAKVCFVSDVANAVPNIGLVFSDENMRQVTSAGSHIDKFDIVRNPEGCSEVKITFPSFPLLQGSYLLDVYLLCENGIHVYDFVHTAAKVTVRQGNLEQGVVSIPHVWGREEV